MSLIRPWRRIAKGNTRMRIRPFLTMVVVAMSLVAAKPAHADEADNFTCRGKVTRDSMVALDGWVNARITEAIDKANQRGRAGCDDKCLQRELQSSVGKSVLRKTLIPHSAFGRWIDAQKNIERCHLEFRDTIYGARGYNHAWLWPFNGRIIYVADSIRLADRVVGLDKIDHFLREGLVHWEHVDAGRGDIAFSIGKEFGPPRRQFSWTEWGLKGMSLTGVLAYADVAAGYFGYRFWSDLLTMGQPGSFLAYNATTGYSQRRPFTFAAYVNDAWDESVNCSKFDGKIGADVTAALARRSMTCAGYPATLAALPDARLYVNPAQFRPAAQTPIHYTLK